MNFKKWVKSIQTAGYNGARTVDEKKIIIMEKNPMILLVSTAAFDNNKLHL